VPSQRSVEVGKHLADILIEVSNTVQRLESRVTFGPKDLLAISPKQHGPLL